VGVPWRKEGRNTLGQQPYQNLGRTTRSTASLPGGGCEKAEGLRLGRSR